MTHGYMSDNEWLLRIQSGEDIRMKRDYLFKLGLTDGETNLLKALLRDDCVATNRAAAKYMMASRLRKKLNRHNIRISSVYGVGYRLTEDMKAKLAKYAEAH